MKDQYKIEDLIEPVTILGTKKILNQLMHCICQIKIKGEFGTGFFCQIPYKNETIKVLMTNYHVLNENDLKENKKIKLLINDEKEYIIIDLEIERKKYFNKDYDIAIIELKDKDKTKDYLELDDNLFQDYSWIMYTNKTIYTLQYSNGKNASVSYGLLNNIDNYNIMDKCFINYSFGSPILNLQNNKLIGIQTKSSKHIDIMGTLLKLPLQDFINKNFINIDKNSIIINKIEYKIIKELGKGGFGKVNQVLSKYDNKYYAIKEIPIKEETKDKIESFQNEANILSKFNCNNIVKYYDIYKDKNKFYILMEFCGYENLKNYIDKNRYNSTLIEPNILNNIIKQICIGIKEIHDMKIVHRDLKPENIFINENMDIKIGDFGISKQLKSYKEYTLTKTKAGTEYYIAPEISDEGIYNEKSDIWSLGCIIYELFNLNIYYKDLIWRKIRKIDSDIYDNKWQNLIDSLLEPDYKKRFDINQVIKFLEDELNINNEDSIKNKINNMNINNKDNIIIGEIYIKQEDINKDIRIINSFENAKREWKWDDKDDDWNYLNEKEIKDNIVIKIDGKIIKFSYYYKFNKEGKYIIEYSFKNNLTKTCYMFYDCKSLINLNLSNFNTKNVINMSYMFYGCNSITILKFSNFKAEYAIDIDGKFYPYSLVARFNTTNVIDMSCMFCGCISLINLDLSDFNTKNVKFMNGMFNNCTSLKNLEISNFNTQNVCDMNNMFSICTSLNNLNLNFNTQNVYNMNSMFSYCKSLTGLILFNFNTQNVTNMSCMFSYCESLTFLDLSNFNTQNVTNMSCMFYNCKSLTGLNLFNFYTQKVTNMSNMFSGCDLLELNHNILTMDYKTFSQINKCICNQCY